MSKRLLQLLALLLTLGLFAAACGDDDGAGSDLDLVSAGTLTVCTDVPYPPMEFEDPDAEGGFTGFDIELMRAIAADLGLGLAVVTPGWDAITSGLATEAGDCDISAASTSCAQAARTPGKRFAVYITPRPEPQIRIARSFFPSETARAAGAASSG